MVSTVGIISIGLVIIGAGIMCLAILETRRLLKLVQSNQSSRSWRILFYLMNFFLVGYAGVAILIGINIPSVMGIIFFAGSWFVLTVVQTGTFTIKELRQINETQLRLQKEKDVAEAIAAIQSEFLSVMNHELRTPLNAILGYSQILDLCLEDKEGIKYNKQIYDSGNHLLELVEYILEYTKLTTKKISPNVEEFNLTELIQSTTKSYFSADKKTDLEFRLWNLCNESLLMRNDAFYVRKVIAHLLNNAAKFTEVGRINLAYVNNDQHVLLMLHDSGVGVEPEYMPKLFKPFSQGDGSTTRQYEGIGLGLVLCKRLIEAMGGLIWLESKGLMAGDKPTESLISLRNRLLDTPQALSETVGTIVFFSLPLSLA